MGSAKSKVNNEVLNETINKTMNETSTKMVNKTTISQEELAKINQSIKLISPKETLLEMKREAAMLAGVLCKGNDQIGQCVKDIMASMVPPACAGGLKISQKAEIKSESSAKLKQVDSAGLEQKMKEALKAKYEAQQTAEADAKAPIVGNAESETNNKTSNKTVNETINKISMEMRNEVEMFQKKNSDMTQAIEVEMFPGMTAGGCDFSQDAAIKSISNIGAAKAMQIIAKTDSDKSVDVEGSTDQEGTAISKGASFSIMGLLGPLLIPIVGIVIVIVVIKVLGSMPKQKAAPAGGSAPAAPGAAPGAAPAAPSFSPTAPSSQYQVGQVITLANGQKALIQGFGKWKRLA